MRRFHSRFAMQALALAMIVSCSGGATNPTAETLNIEFTSPNEDDGAILFTIAGGPVESIDGSGHSVYSARPDPNTLRVILTGRVSSGVIGRIRIPDGDRASQYSVAILQLASLSHMEREPAGYTIRLAE
jgi:hypothetical protein